jgi:hypothetical protein
MEESPDVEFALVVTLCCNRIIGDIEGLRRCPFCGCLPLKSSKYTHKSKILEGEVIPPISQD